MVIYIKILINDKAYFFPMPDKQVVIGRSQECEIPVKDDFCSSMHCSLVFYDNKIIIKDLNSKNGTFLNGDRIDQEDLYVGDIVQFGTVKIQIDEAHTDKKALMQLAQPSHRQASIPYYDSKDLTQTHIKLKDFNLKKDNPSAKSKNNGAANNRSVKSFAREQAPPANQPKSASNSREGFFTKFINKLKG